MDSIQWTGENTDEVVSFCTSWEPALCGIYNEFTNELTGKRTLEIEPGDTMRGYSLFIPINAVCVRSKDGYRRFITVVE